MTIDRIVDWLNRPSARDSWQYAIPSFMVAIPFLGIIICFALLDRQIAMREKMVMARVTSQDGQNGHCYRYVFDAKGLEYTGCDAVQNKTAPRVGQRAEVFYDPENPTRNHLYSFWEKSRRDLRHATIFITLALFHVAVVVWAKLDRWRRLRKEA